MDDPRADEVLKLTQRLLECVAEGDWDTYARLCDPGITAFEPEALGYLVEGLPFHRYYFDNWKKGGAKHTTMASPHVRLLGDSAAVVSYVRLVQRQTPEGSFVTTAHEETRVWQRENGAWKHVHFHRSANR